MSEGGINAVQRAFAIAEFTMEQGPVTASNVAAHFNIPVSTAHDHLKTLAAQYYLINDDGEYCISTKWLNIAIRDRNDRTIYKAAKEPLDELAEESGEHVTLMVEEGGLGVLLYVVLGEQAVDLTAYSGMRMRLHTVAPGKAILSHLPEDCVSSTVDQFSLKAKTDNTITDRATLDQELEQIRTDGVAFDREERIVGMRSVAAPVLTIEGEVVGAISVYGPKNRMKGDYFTETLPDMILQTKNVIEVNMNYQ